jgi:hypothetical protein
MRWIDDIRCIKRKIKLTSGIVWTVSIGHPPSLQEPPTIVRPSMITNYHHSACVFIVGKQVAHGDSVVPSVIREGEHNVILL